MNICKKLPSECSTFHVGYPFIFVVFPLIGVSTSRDALIDITGGKVNIDVLMALAASASVFMGNPLEGGLLLVMFNPTHIAEGYFTSRSVVDVEELKKNYPDFALVLEVNNNKPPKFSHLAYKKVPLVVASHLKRFKTDGTYVENIDKHVESF